MSAAAIEPEHHALYRFFDDEGALLYVGISVNPLGRWDQHRAKTWWRDVRTATIEPCESREAALKAELAAIRAENPQHNIRRGVAMRAMAFRVDDALWNAARAISASRRETVSGVIKRLLAEYIDQHATDEDRAAAREGR